MRIGIDLDNTIACYDEVFRRVAGQHGLLAGGSPAAGAKRRLREELRAHGRDDEWTELQGRVYGPLMDSALPFDGARAFWRRCRREGVEAFVVSHRTLHPYRGSRHDLHGAALRWLARHGFVDDGARGDRVFLETTVERKAERIGALGCTHFIDDLEEFLLDAALPAGLVRIHFDPGGGRAGDRGLVHVSSWRELTEWFFGRPGATS